MINARATELSFLCQKCSESHDKLLKASSSWLKFDKQRLQSW